MEVEFADQSLHRLECDRSYDGSYGRDVVRAFRMRIQLIRAAADERDFRAMKSLHFEKLKGDRAGQYSMRINQQWRLILKFEKRPVEKKIVLVISITDYH